MGLGEVEEVVEAVVGGSEADEAGGEGGRGLGVRRGEKVEVGGNERD